MFIRMSLDKSKYKCKLEYYVTIVKMLKNLDIYNVTLVSSTVVAQ